MNSKNDRPSDGSTEDGATDVPEVDETTSNLAASSSDSDAAGKSGKVKKGKKKAAGKKKSGKAFSRMPVTKEAVRILQERADELAKTEQQAANATEGEAFICFRLGASEQYGISHEHASEIIEPGLITKVPCVPASIIGVVNRRGDLLTVLDLKQFFRMEDTGQTDSGRVIVVSNGELTVGIYADEIIGEARYDTSRLADPLPSDGVRNIFHVKGIHDGKVTILDMDALLGDEALVVDRNRDERQ
jgi:purine-binding chemotaxis protein CheW